MIEYIKGKVSEKYPTHLILETNGIGYFINITLFTYSKLERVKTESVKILVHTIYREDSRTIYGFYSEAERAMFKLLINISGIGGQSAQTLLSSYDENKIKIAILSSDVNLLKSAKGIGTKTAERIIVELKDKIEISDMENVISTDLNNTISNEALSALEVLGFSKKQTEKVIRNILSRTPDMTVEELVKEALSRL